MMMNPAVILNVDLSGVQGNSISTPTLVNETQSERAVRNYKNPLKHKITQNKHDVSTSGNCNCQPLPIS